MKKNEQNFRKIWVPIKHTNICMMGEPEGKEREGSRRSTEEIRAVKFPLNQICQSTPPGSSNSK